MYKCLLCRTKTNKLALLFPYFQREMCLFMYVMYFLLSFFSYFLYFRQVKNSTLNPNAKEFLPIKGNAVLVSLLKLSQTCTHTCFIKSHALLAHCKARILILIYIKFNIEVSQV